MNKLFLTFFLAALFNFGACVQPTLKDLGCNPDCKGYLITRGPNNEKFKIKISLGLAKDGILPLLFIGGLINGLISK